MTPETQMVNDLGNHAGNLACKAATSVLKLLPDDEKRYSALLIVVIQVLGMAVACALRHAGIPISEKARLATYYAILDYLKENLQKYEKEVLEEPNGDRR